MWTCRALIVAALLLLVGCTSHAEGDTHGVVPAAVVSRAPDPAPPSPPPVERPDPREEIAREIRVLREYRDTMKVSLPTSFEGDREAIFRRAEGAIEETDRYIAKRKEIDEKIRLLEIRLKHMGSTDQ